MKASYLKTVCMLLSVLLTLGFIVVGCKKETPPPQEPAAPAPPTQEQIAKEKEFLAAPDVVTYELEKTTISKLDLSLNDRTYLVRRIKWQSRENLKQAQITLANRSYKILLGLWPEREFYMYDIETGINLYWTGSWNLYSYHKIDDKLYEFMLIDQDKKIAVRPYKGPLGIFKVGKGGRELEKVEFSGSLIKEDSRAVPARAMKENWPDAVTECAIPVGNYIPSEMYVTYDNLLIGFSYKNRTAQGQTNRKDIVYGMQIRQDKPYVLDFSNEPKVIFYQPMVIFNQMPMSQTSFSRGREIKFEAVLIDPKLDIMIRGLDDTSVKVDKEYKDADGKVIHTAKVSKSLDPNVVITRADGEVIAEGVMPFG